MKKILFIAAVALAAAACSKTFDTNPAASQKAIGFGTWAETMTKAYDGTWATDDAFKVYGTKTVSGSPIDVFTGEEVVYSTSTSKWSYSPLKYWDLSAAKYNFYAFLPASELATGTTAGVFASKEITFEHPQGKEEDILVASEAVRERATASLMATDAVELHFNHMASLVDIKVKKAESLGGDATVKIKSASLTGIKSKGTLNVKGYDNSTAKPTYDDFGWTAEGTAESYNATAALPFTVPAVSTYKDNGDVDTTTPASFGGIFTSCVFMPQDLTQNQKLVFTYNISTTDGADVDYNASIDLKDFVKADNTSNTGAAITGWYPGVHYTYYVTISAKAIEFTADVVDWTEESGYHYLIN